MEILVAAVGRAKNSPEAELTAMYLKRTRWDVALKELPDAPSAMDSATRKAAEAQSIRKHMTEGSRLVALDAMGEQLSSPQFAHLIAEARRDGAKRLLFAIGGQDGLDASLLADARRVVAFGRATWPHKLVRVMLAEQIYRAYTISIGHPYHEGH
ncbi:MAG: 23S rRNA (pseudouridine(1915)-N(3))-methyltransferase RlmH [Alphaproteobacteria bacterium]